MYRINLSLEQETSPQAAVALVRHPRAVPAAARRARARHAPQRRARAARHRPRLRQAGAPDGPFEGNWSVLLMCYFYETVNSKYYILNGE